VGVPVPTTPQDADFGLDGTSGADGNITLIVNSVIGSDVNLDANTGNLNVTLNQGAEVGGMINANSASTSTLTFNLSTENESDYAAALATLIPANASAGTISIDGRTYTWTGFDSLVNQIKLLIEAARSGCAVNGRINFHDCGAPVAIFVDEAGVITLRSSTQGLLARIAPSQLPEPGTVSILVTSAQVVKAGRAINVYLYLLTNGQLMLVAGDYAFTWLPATS
jgi:hypothetical protein